MLLLLSRFSRVSVRPHRWQATRLCCPWDSPGKNTGVGCHVLLQDAGLRPLHVLSQFSKLFLKAHIIITLLTEVHLVKAMVFPVVMYACESWTTKKAECQRIDAFELWC